MSGIRESSASGLEAVQLASTLLQRARRTDPLGGVWEAADVQWWWRRPSASDGLEQHFWLDSDGPVAGLLVTEFRGRWQLDALAVSGFDRAPAIDRLLAVPQRPAEVLARSDDTALAGKLSDAGFAGAESGGIAWLDVARRPTPSPLPEGFRIVDRRDTSKPHPMRERNGEGVEERLRETPLYDPALDLAVETLEGKVAGYVLFWPDPTTGVGLLEPMRVHDAFQRLGLARALIAEGLERLAAASMPRAKVGFTTDAGRALYLRAGFSEPSPLSEWTLA